MMKPPRASQIDNTTNDTAGRRTIPCAPGRQQTNAHRTAYRRLYPDSGAAPRRPSAWDAPAAAAASAAAAVALYK